MKIENKKMVVTGGAGFLGSHLVEKLIDLNNDIIVLDNFSTGKIEFINHLQHKKKLSVCKTDLLNISVKELAQLLKSTDVVWHLAANPEVKVGETNTRIHIDQNLFVTYNLLEAMRTAQTNTIIFTSTSTVYGDAITLPTPEEYGPLLPISTYGASKLACEALITAYCHTFNMRTIIFRFGNVIGPRLTHGVIFDFINKLHNNPAELEILGNGEQLKSYCYITDCIDAMLFACRHSKGRINIFNISSEDACKVSEIADIVVKKLNLKSVKYRYTGGVEGGRGWKGDVKRMLLSIAKLKKMGWKPKYSSKEAVAHTVEALLKDRRKREKISGKGAVG